MKLKFVPLALFLYLLCACSAPKGITYFQDLDDPNKKPAALEYNQYVPKICTGDLLTITVSALDPAAVAPFNLPVVTFAKQTEQMFNGTKEIGSSQAMQTYTVDSDGSINFVPFGDNWYSCLTQGVNLTFGQGTRSGYLPAESGSAYRSRTF